MSPFAVLETQITFTRTDRFGDNVGIVFELFCVTIRGAGNANHIFRGDFIHGLGDPALFMMSMQSFALSQ